MTPETLATVTVDALAVGRAAAAIASAAGVPDLPAARLALAAAQLADDPRQPVVVALAVVPGDDGPRVEAAVRHTGGVRGHQVVPAGLVDACYRRTTDSGEVEEVLGVALDPPADHGPQAATLTAVLAAVDERSRQFAEARAETEAMGTELDETNRGLLAIHGELHTANQRIADLLAMLSHDIRQPLGVISSYTALLIEEWDRLDDAGRRRDIARIADAGAGMNQLVEEILTLTQLDADGLSSRAAQLDVRRAVAEAIASVCGAEPDTVVILDGPPVCALVDPRHLHQIIANLVSNGLKYGAPPVEITIEAGDWVEITVRDHGSGVPADFVPRLFQRFARADTPASRAKRGTGLGLYIVHQIVQANRGTVRYGDHPDGGGCFVVRLPVALPGDPV